MDSTSEARCERLRRIATEEIETHRTEAGLLGAALDGSVATGAVWPTSDLDFTILPEPGRLQNSGVEWGQRDGIVWHKHITYRGTLRELMEGFPESFIRPAQGPFNHDANWMLDGLAVMEIVEDPSGILAETKRFVSARRFDPEVWQSRRAAFLEELHRLLNAARQQLENGEATAAYRELSSTSGFASVAAQIWLEAAQVIYSSKEQDGLFAKAAQDAGHPEAHQFYREVLAVDPGHVEEVSPLLLQIAEKSGGFYLRVGDGATMDHYFGREALAWAAWAHHFSETMAIAPSQGHPACVYQRCGGNWSGLGYWVSQWPERIAEEFRAAETPDAGELTDRSKELTMLYEEVVRCLLPSEGAAERASSSLRAAEALLKLTEEGTASHCS